jgi:Ca2+-binding EF-hand superfamily protein
MEIAMKDLNRCAKAYPMVMVFCLAVFGINPSLSAAEATGSGPGTDSQGTQASPAFQDADKNGDHYVTKDELKDQPRLLERFDEVDAGKDGKLEQHEYGNLVMEKKKEGYK